ncbi:MAG: hypothetical protein JNM84_17215, partial [Planctomycetes bacterium]|nr:hypothetical protein [Planctomycetota bacterium]
MQRTQIVIVAVLAALGLLAALLFRSGGDTPLTEVAPLAGESSTGAQPSESAASSITRDEGAAPAVSSPPVDRPTASASSTSALRVRALDHEGRPLPGARFVVYDAEVWKRQRESSPPLWRAEADLAGRASWPEVGPVMEKLAASEGLAVTLEGFVPHLAPVFLAGTSDLEIEHELRAPAFGSVVVHVVGPLGEPWPRDSVNLIAWTGRGTVLELGGQKERDDSWFTPIENGVARFPFVGLGVPLRAYCRSNGVLEVAVDAPALTTAGEEREIRLAFGSDRAVLRLRVCDETGQPLADHGGFQLRMHIDGKSAALGGLPVAAGGVLWLDVPANAPRPCEVEVFLQEVFPQRRGSVTTRAQVARTTGIVDLGDVLLRRGPLLASGRVLRPDGTPAVGATLQAAFTVVSADAKRGGLHFDSLRIKDAEGRFTWHAPAEASAIEPQFELEADLQDRGGARFVASKQLVNLGATDLEIRLEALGSIQGTWRAGAPWSEGDLSVRLVPEDTAAAGSDHIGGTLHPGGFGFPAQRAGRYTARIYAQGTLLLEIQELVVRAGEACDDPRLRDIDLGAKVMLLAYEIVTPPSFTSPRVGTLYARPAGEPGASWTKREFWTKEARIVVPRGRYDVAIVAAGARLVRFAAVEQGQRVELEVRLPVVLALEGRPEGLAEGEHLRARLAMELDGLPLEVDSERFGADGTARIGIPAPGPYRVSWLRERDRDNGVDSQPWSTTTSTIEIGESA